MDVTEYIEANASGFFDSLKQWLAIPSMSGEPDNEQDVRRSAEWFAGYLRDIGFPVAEVWQSEGLPAVFAEWPSDDPDAPTVVVYGHHDVQPVEPLDEWRSPPFEPLQRDGRIYARGAADDKGQVFFHTLGLRAHLAAGGRTAPAVNLKLLVEGEEESGSPHFGALLRANRERLHCDVVVVSDTGMWDAETPSTCVSMRGLVDCDVNFYGPTGDVHSGVFGGAIPNPATELCRVLAGMHDDDRHITIDGFYDDVAALEERERDLLAKLPFDEQVWLSNAKSSAATGEAGYSTLERATARPTAEINGIWGGHIGAGHKTIVPAEAHAKLSFRLVSGQQPPVIQRLFESWLAARVPDGIRHQVRWHGPGVRPCVTPMDHPAVGAVVGAMRRAFDSEVLYTREGGSGPEADLADVLDAPVVFLGVSLPDDGWHAPNEKVETDLLLTGARAAAYLWEDLPRRLRQD